MTTRRLPRSARGRALPPCPDDRVTWPAVLRGRSTLLCLLLLGWLGGGLLASGVAVVTQGPDDLAYGLTNVVAAATGLLLLMAVGLRDRSRRRHAHATTVPVPVAEPVPVTVPEQADGVHLDQHLPALR